MYVKSGRRNSGAASEIFFGSHHLFLFGKNSCKSQERRCVMLWAAEYREGLSGVYYTRNRCELSEVLLMPSRPVIVNTGIVRRKDRQGGQTVESFQTSEGRNSHEPSGVQRPAKQKGGRCRVDTIFVFISDSRYFETECTQ
jgi:hypothetical protein